MCGTRKAIIIKNLIRRKKRNMKKFLKVLMSSALALAMALVSLTGCTSSATMTSIKDPASNATDTTVSTGGSTGAEVGLTAGFELPHGSGMVDNTSDQVMIYDSDYYYHNEVRATGADPGAWYVSEEDALDSYTKLKYREMEKLGERFNIDIFERDYGTWEYWQETYANRFYVITTGSQMFLSAKTRQKYPTAIYGLYMMRTSTDLNNWEKCGEIEDFAIMAENDGWYNTQGQNCWAPEFNRDPVTGLYIICASTNSKSGDESTEYNPVTSLYDYYDEQWDRLTLLIAVSYNPAGPYRTISAEEYYSSMAQYNEDGSVKTITVGEGENVKEMAVYREDLLDEIGKEGQTDVPLTEYKDGKFLNLNGNVVTKNTPALNFSYYHEKIKEAYPHWYMEDRGIWPCIDINPVVNSKGEIYMYFSQHTSSVMSGNHLWVVHMKDWITPEWDSLTHISTSSYSVVYNDGESADGMKYLKHTKQPDGSYVTTNDEYRRYAINGVMGYYMGEASEGRVNEGAFVIEKDGWYYLTYSPFGYGSRNYSLYLAVANNPYGPFVKLPDYSPCLGLDKYDDGDYISGTGHHSFIWAGDELYVAYHCFFNPVDNYNDQNQFMGRALGFDKIDFYDYDQIKFGDIVANQIEKDLEAEAEEENWGKRKDGVPEEYDFDVTEEWIRDRFIDCNNSDYYGVDATEIYRENDIIPLPYGNGPTYSLQPKPEVSLPDGLGNVMDDEDVSLELIYGDQDTLKYANDGMFTYQRWSQDYELAGDAQAKQIKLKIKFGSPKLINNIMIYNSRTYDYGFTQVKSVVFKLSDKPSWYPTGYDYNGYCYIKDLKADPQGWNDSNFTMRKGGSAMATFLPIPVSEIIITVSADDKIDPVLGRNIVKLSEIYVMGKPVTAQA